MIEYSGRIGPLGCLVPVQVRPAADQPVAFDLHKITAGQFAQINTGLAETFITDIMASILEMEARRMETIETPYGQADCVVYRIDIDLALGAPPGPLARSAEIASDVEVYELKLLDNEFSVILGRHVLDRVRLDYDGATRRFAVSVSA